MTELQVIDIILAERRHFGVPDPERLSREWRALQLAARRIVSECNSDCRRAARAASQVGFAVTRGRTRL